MKKDFLTLSGFLGALFISCTIANAASSVMLASAETIEPAAKATIQKSETPVALEATAVKTSGAEEAAEELGEIESDEYEPRTQFSGFILGSWWDGFGTEDTNRTNINQVWLTAERELDTETYGADWGYCVDMVFGTSHAQSADGFDGKWGESGDGYGASFFQAYAEVGVNNLSVKVGKFGTTVGFESFKGIEPIYNSYSYMYDHEPLTHCGALATYDVSDRFSVNFGVTTGSDNSFENPNDDIGFLFGASYQITDRLSVGYTGLWNRANGPDRASFSYDFFDLFEGTTADDCDEYLQTIIVGWDITERFNYSFVCNYGSMAEKHTSNALYGQVGIGNYFTYELTEKITAGLRYEWFKQWSEDGADVAADFTEASYHEVSLGVAYNMNEHVLIRPEIRYDWVNEGEKDDGFSGGLGVAVKF